MFTSQPHQEAKDTQLSCHQAAEGDLRDEGDGAKSLLKAGGESPPSLPHLPRHPCRIGIRLWKWGSGTWQHGLIFTGWGIVQGELVYLTHHDCFSYGKKGIHDSLLRETEGSLCWPDPNHREVCCLLGVQVGDVTKKLSSLESYFYNDLWLLSITLFQTSSNEVPRSQRSIKRDLTALG